MASGTSRKTKEQLLAENEELRRRLEGTGGELSVDVITSQLPLAWAYHELVQDDAGQPVDYVFLEANPVFKDFTGLDPEAIRGKRVTEIIPGIEKAEPDLIALYGQVALTGEPTSLELRFEPLDRWYQIYCTSPKRGYFTVTFNDITRSKQMLEDLQSAEAEVRRLNRTLEERVTQQAQAIMELSTPRIELFDGVLLMPLIGVIDTARARQITENLLDAIVAHESRIAILDVTGVPVVDTGIAQNLMKAVAAVRMLGAEVLVSGLSPEVAQTLVRLGVDLENLRTFGTLRAAIAQSLRNLGQGALATALADSAG